MSGENWPSQAAHPSSLVPRASLLAPHPISIAPRPSSLIPSLRRIAVTFATVLVAFWAYRLLAVPWIEPAAGRIETGRIEIGPAPDRLAELRGLFAAGDWELSDQATILEIGRIKLLWKKLTELGDGKAELEPFTMIIVPGAPSASEAERLRQAFVLQAPQGALLTFDGPLAFGKGAVGRLTEGRLRGDVTIRNRGKLPGNQDAFLLTTRNVDFDEHRLGTAEPVEFTWGRSSGRGTQFEAKFLPGEPGDDEKTHGLNIGGLQSATLSHLDRLRLDLGSTGSLFGKRSPGAKVAPRTTQPEPSLVEITCRGPVIYDPSEQALVFRHEVDVLQSHAVGPSDQINCEVLAVGFVRRRTLAAGNKEPAIKSTSDFGGMFDLEAQRIEATGNPVVIRAPSQEMEGRGDHLQYDLQTGTVILDAAQEAFFRRGPGKTAEEIHGPHLEYQVGQQGHLGRALVDGPGWLRMNVKTQGRADQPLTARWGKNFRVEPQDDQHKISLLGGGRIDRGTLGSLSGDQIEFWFQEVRGEPVPQRMCARGQVRLDSAKIDGAVGELMVWFIKQPAAAAGAGDGGRGAGDGERTDAQSRIGVDRSENAGLGQSANSSSPIPNPQSPIPLSSPAPRPPSPAPSSLAPPPADPATAQHFHIEGATLNAQLVLLPAGAELAQLVVQDNARLVETQTASPDQQPVVITGDQVHVLDASKPTMWARVIGNPAHVEGRGRSMSGPNISVNCGLDQLLIQGPGSMELPVDRNMAGNLSGGANPQSPIPNPPPSQPVPLVIAWQRQMKLAATARFEESVVATTPGQEFQTEQLKVVFTEPLHLAGLQLQSKAKPWKVECPGEVWMKTWDVAGGQQSPVQQAPVQQSLVSQTPVPQGPVQQTSVQRMHLFNVQIDLVSGAVHADGPVHANTVRRQEGQGLRPELRGPANGIPKSRTPRPAPPASAPLVCLDVRSQGPLTGNIHNRTFAFQEQVRAVYVPTSAWDTVPQTDVPAELGPGAMVLHCEELRATQMVVPVGGVRSWDIQATGNAMVEGTTADGAPFFARAPRMSYDEGKGLMILEGDPRADVVLSQQRRPGDQRKETRGQLIHYWPKTGEAEVLARSLDLNGPRPLGAGTPLGGRR